VKYLIWIPITIFYNFFACLIAVKVGHKDFLLNYLLLTLIGIIPTWAIAAYYSTNLIFDSLLFDMILVVSSVLFLGYLGQAEKFVLVKDRKSVV